MLTELRNKETGAITRHHEVDAKEILRRGEHERVADVPAIPEGVITNRDIATGNVPQPRGRRSKRAAVEE